MSADDRDHRDLAALAVPPADRPWVFRLVLLAGGLGLVGLGMLLAWLADMATPTVVALAKALT